MDIPPFPVFDWEAFPDAERDRAQHIQAQLVLLRAIVVFFDSAMHLVWHARGQGNLDWMAMGGVNAILSLYNFRSTANSILDGVGRCPTLKRHVSTKELHDTIVSFDKAFPDCLELRDGVCHYSDKLFAPPSAPELMVLGDDFMHGAWGDFSLHYFVENRVVAQSITTYDLDQLTDHMEDVFIAFRKVARPRQKDQTSHQ